MHIDVKYEENKKVLTVATTVLRFNIAKDSVPCNLRRMYGMTLPAPVYPLIRVPDTFSRYEFIRKVISFNCFGLSCLLV